MTVEGLRTSTVEQGGKETADRTSSFRQAVARCFSDIERQTGVSFLVIRGNDGVVFGYTDMARSECFFQSPARGENGQTYVRRYETFGGNTVRTEFVEDEVGDLVHISAPLHEFNFLPDANSHSAQPLVELIEVLDQIELGGKAYISRRKSSLPVEQS